MESWIVAGTVRPFCYRPTGQKKWRVGYAIVGCDVRAFLRDRLEPHLGPLEVDLRPVKRPSGLSALAWGAELAHRARESPSRAWARVRPVFFHT